MRRGPGFWLVAALIPLPFRTRKRRSGGAFFRGAGLSFLARFPRGRLSDGDVHGLAKVQLHADLTMLARLYAGARPSASRSARR
jgi:hypothetical protein